MIFFVFVAKIAAARGRWAGKPNSPPEIKYEQQSADPFSLYGLIGVVDAEFNWAIVAPPLRLAPVIPAFAGIQTVAAKPAARNQA